MKVIVNPEGKKYLPFIMLIAIFILALLVRTDVRYYQKYSKYEKTSAIITDVEHKVTSSEYDNSTSHENIITYKYNVDGNEYEASREEVTKFGKRVGKEVNIKYNPENPEEIQDVFGQKICLFMTAVISFFAFITVVAIKQTIQERVNGED